MKKYFVRTIEGIVRERISWDSDSDYIPEGYTEVDGVTYQATPPGSVDNEDGTFTPPYVAPIVSRVRMANLFRLEQEIAIRRLIRRGQREGATVDEENLADAFDSFYGRLQIAGDSIDLSDPNVLRGLALLVQYAQLTGVTSEERDRILRNELPEA